MTNEHTSYTTPPNELKEHAVDEPVPSPLNSADDTRECSACREQIAVDAKICPYCRSSQNKLHIGSQAVRWTAAALTLVTLVLGLREGIDLVAARLETRAVLRKNLDAAANLLVAGEYRAAWDLTEDVAKRAPGNPRLANERLSIARAWLLDARTLGSERGFLDIIDRVVLFLSATAPSKPQPEQAEVLALLAFAERLRERSEVVSLNVSALYQKAIETDPACGLAHLLLGHDLALWGKLADATPHLSIAADRATSGNLDPALLRRYQFAALTTNIRRQSEETRQLAAIELMRAVNDVQNRGETLPINPQRLYFGQSTLWNELERLHLEAAIQPDKATSLSSALPDSEYLDTLRWIKDNRPKQLRIDGIKYRMAMILEQQGDREGAASTLQGIPTQRLNYRLAPLVDQALIRLTGQPHRPLKERDPWAWRIKILSTTEPGSPGFDKVLNRVGAAADDYHDGRRSNQDELLTALKAADKSWSSKRKKEGTLSQTSLERWRKLRFDLGIILKDKKMLQDALSVLSELAGELEPGHRLRGGVLVETAAVQAQLAITDQQQRAMRIRKGTALLVRAVEKEGYVDWARLRWHSDLAPLHETPEFNDLLKRHGRTPPVAMAEMQNVK